MINRDLFLQKKSNLENSNVVMSIVWLSMVKILIYKNVDKFSRICTSKNKCTVVKCEIAIFKSCVGNPR